MKMDSRPRALISWSNATEPDESNPDERKSPARHNGPQVEIFFNPVRLIFSIDVNSRK